MDREAEMSDREDEARQGDTGMIGSDSEEPGPGRDTSLTEPDPVAGRSDQPQTTVAMSEADPMRTRLGSHVAGAGELGYDVAAAEEGATQETPAEDRPGYEPEHPAGETTAAWAGPTDAGQDVPATYTGEEADVTGRPEYAERDEGGDQAPYQEELQRADRPGGGGSLFTDEEPERLDRPGPQEPGVEEGVYDQEADRARQQRPSDGL
jgi:hypothetical protein